MKNKSIEAICYELIESATLPDEIREQAAFQELCVFYDKNSEYVDLTPVSSFIFNYDSTAQNTAADFIYSLSQALKKEHSINPTKIKNYTLLRKILDHMDLANLQKTFILRKQEEQIVRIQSRIDDEHKNLLKMESSMRTNEKNAEEVSGQIETFKSDVYTNIIAILGIFSAFLFGMFGGFDSFSNILSGITDNKIRVARVLLESSILMFGLVVLIFLLIHAVGILSNRNYLACGCPNTGECNHPMYRRYPIFTLAIFFFGSLIALSMLLTAFNANGAVYKILFHGTKIGHTIVDLVAMLLIFIIICGIVYLYKKLFKDKVEVVKN